MKRIGVLLYITFVFLILIGCKKEPDEQVLNPNIFTPPTANKEEAPTQDPGPDMNTIEVPIQVMEQISYYLDVPIEELTLETFQSVLKFEINAYTKNAVSVLPLMEELQFLSISVPIEDLSVISELKNLKTLIISNNNVSNIDFLKELTKLEFLSLDRTGLKSLSGIEGMQNLKELHVWNNQIDDITPLSNLTELEVLNLAQNNINSAAPLSELKQLTWLQLEYNQISDISSLSNLTKLNRLDVSSNPIQSIAALENLANLENLFLYNTQVSDLSPLKQLDRLNFLDIYFTNVTSVQPIAHLNNLKTFQFDPGFVEDWHLLREDLTKHIPR